MKGRLNNLSIESFLVMTLLVIFAIAMSIVILRGSDSYERLLSKKENEENMRIAFSYMNLQVKKNDRADAIELIDEGVEGQKMLAFRHDGEENGYTTYVYYNEGYLMECYTDETPTLLLSEEIVEVEELVFDYDDVLLSVTVGYESHGEMTETTRYISRKSNEVN